MNEEMIFAAALEKSPGERQAFLDEACGEDPALRAAVEWLLKADADVGSFLEHPTMGKEATLQTSGNRDAAHDAGRANVRLDFLERCEKPDRLGRLDQYEIMEVVGQGGMGIVLRGFDTKLSRVVAVKVMSPLLATNVTAVKRFLREAKTAAAVHHEHVVTIHAVDDAHDPPYLVMEFVEGQTLQQKVEREGGLAVAQILRIGSQAAAGLAAAHRTGLIHRDIKPSNILLENGVERVKLTDFGLARAADDLQITQTGLIAGTPQYMSPEQAKDEPIDARSDLFSLGSVLYTMCTGRPAFRAGSTVAVLKRVCDDTPRPIHALNLEIPDWLAELVNKLLAKNPADRFQSAAEVADLLGEYLAHVQNPAIARLPAAALLSEKVARTPPSHGPSAPLWLWSGSWLVGLVALAIGLLTATSFIRGRTGGVALVLLTFWWMGVLLIWTIASQLRHWPLAGTKQQSGKRAPSVARGVFFEHPAIGSFAIALLMISIAFSSYWRIGSWYRRTGLGLRAERAAEAVEPPFIRLPAYERPESLTEWTAPENPDPQGILNAARVDFAARRYELALKKLSWYHEHAVEYQPAQAGVRRTFAMTQWESLADAYPPAGKQLRAYRDRAAENVKEGVEVREAFQDLAVINQVLGTESHTKELFELLHSQQPELAKRVYSMAEPALVRTKSYRLCNDYLAADASLHRTIAAFQGSKMRSTAKPPAPELSRLSERMFTGRVTTLVALLVVNGRMKEALRVAEQAKREWPDAGFRAKVDDALKGHVPEPQFSRGF